MVNIFSEMLHIKPSVECTTDTFKSI
uniref:Uncharacterized protein n=1 Tax=Arundo donax TaxID=35708 RepID=A0A0A9ALJ0_ARUDO